MLIVLVVSTTQEKKSNKQTYIEHQLYYSTGMHDAIKVESQFTLSFNARGLKQRKSLSSLHHFVNVVAMNQMMPILFASHKWSLRLPSHLIYVFLYKMVGL